MKRKINKKALQAAQRTLDGIDMDAFWKRVMESVAPKVEANERMRARSWAKAWGKGLP